LIQRFCNEASQRDPFNRSEAFEIHNHKVYTPGGGVDFRINSWVRCRSAVLSLINQPGIAVEQDLNTLAEEAAQRRFAPVELRNFFAVVAHEADSILRKYFPEGGSL